MYEVISGTVSVVTHERLCSRDGEKYFSFSDLGMRNNTTSVDGTNTPLCSKVVYNELIVGVLDRVIPICNQHRRVIHTISALGHFSLIFEA